MIKAGYETRLVVDRVMHRAHNHRQASSAPAGGGREGRGESKQTTTTAVIGGNRMSDLAFGNITSNSYVFVGGLPSWYSGGDSWMDTVVLPTVHLEPRFRGAVRHLRYRDTRASLLQASSSQSPPSPDSANRLQEMMAYKVSPSITYPSLRLKLRQLSFFFYILQNYSHLSSSSFRTTPRKMS